MDDPAIAPGTKKAQVGRPDSTVAMSAAVEVAKTASSGSRTRRWPCESTSRAIRGEVNA